MRSWFAFGNLLNKFGWWFFPFKSISIFCLILLLLSVYVRMCVHVMWGFSCAQGIKWRWNVYFGSSWLLWSNSFSLYSLPFYILNLLLFSISYHHNYYGHMSCLFYTRLILFTALLLRLFADLSCQISLMQSTLSCPRPREEWWARKFYRVLEQKMIKIWKLNTWFNFEQPDTLEHQPDIYVYLSYVVNEKAETKVLCLC